MKEETTKKYMIYTNFDRRRIGITTNDLDYQVGDFTLLEKDKGKVMVYALINLSDDAEYVIRHSFKKIYSECRCEKFHDHLNKVVETIILLAHDDARITDIKEEIEVIKAFREDFIWEQISRVLNV